MKSGVFFRGVLKKSPRRNTHVIKNGLNNLGKKGPGSGVGPENTTAFCFCEQTVQYRNSGTSNLPTTEFTAEASNFVLLPIVKFGQDRSTAS